MNKQKLKWFLNNFENVVGTFFAICMVVLMLLQVISRYLFTSPINWTEELAIVSFILSVYFGAAGAVFRNQHLRLNILTNFLKDTHRELLNVVTNVFIVVFLAVSFYGMATLVENLYSTKAALAISGLPKYIVYGVIAFTLLLFIVRVIQDSIHSIQKYMELRKEAKKPQEGGEEQ